MNNQDTLAARQFHDATKYVLAGTGEGDRRILMGTPPWLGPAIGEQDPAIEPFPYKVYTTLEPLPLAGANSIVQHARARSDRRKR